MAQSTGINSFNKTCWNCTNVQAGSLDDSSSDTFQLLSRGSLIALSVIAALAGLIGSVGNALVLLAVFKYETLRTIPDLFITSLAFSDLTVCALFLPMSIYYYHHPNAKEENLAFFVTKTFLGHASMVASATNMFAVTIDRVIAIRFPFRYIEAITKMHAAVAITIVWIISIAFGALYTREFISRYYIAFYSALLLLSTIAIYIHIFIVAKRQENRIQDITKGSDGSAVEKKVAKTIFTVVGFYAVCWLPVLLLPAIVNPVSKAVQFRRVFPWVKTVLACNSAVNPYIYCMRSNKYRSAFAKILGRKSPDNTTVGVL